MRTRGFPGRLLEKDWSETGACSNYFPGFGATSSKPVLAKLEFLRSAGDRTDLPRVTWMVRGSHGSLPFHAAGLAELGSLECTMEHVMSSYTSNLKAFVRWMQTPATIQKWLRRRKKHSLSSCLRRQGSHTSTRPTRRNLSQVLCGKQQSSTLLLPKDISWSGGQVIDLKVRTHLSVTTSGLFPQDLDTRSGVVMIIPKCHISLNI